MLYIYAIIRKKDSKKLDLLKEIIEIPKNIDDDVLCGFFDYAISLSEAYSSCLPELSNPRSASFLVTKKYRLEAYAMREISKIVRENNDVVAISHRHGGFTHINWNFGENVSFHIYTNFGYGSVSDFNSTFMYKDIVLAPYSYYVKYKYSTYASVVSCTNCYHLNYQEWEQVMNDCLEFYNAIVSNNEHYVFNWINRQLQELVSGLESFLINDRYPLYNGWGNNHISTYTFVSGDDFWMIKAKKIANSLCFLDNIKVLPSQIETEAYSERIISVFKRFLPKLRLKISETEKRFNNVQEIIDKLKDYADYQLYTRLKDKYYYKKDWYRSQFKMLWYLMHLLQKISPNYDLQEIRQHFAPLKKRIDDIDAVSEELSKIKYLLTSLQESESIMIRDELQKQL